MVAEDARQFILDQANTIDESDALSKVRASYHREDMPFVTYFEQVKAVLYKMQFAPYNRYCASAEQLRFIMTDAKFVAVCAAAGSGKTATLTRRILIQKDTHNWKGEELLIISFTKNSATDMARQYNRLCDMFGVARDVEFRTIHKFGKDMIMLLAPNLKLITEENKLEIYEYDPELEEERKTEYTLEDILRVSLRIAGVNKEGERSLVSPTQIYNVFSVISEKMITSDTELRETSENYVDFPISFETIMAVKRIYQQRKKELGCIDYLDMLDVIYQTLQTVPALNYISNPTLREYLTFKAIYVDEVQDVSPLQVGIIKELLRLNPDCQLTVVGDDDQSIYGFRGADPSFLLNFISIFPPKEPEEIGIDEEGEPIYSKELTVQQSTELIYMTTNRRSDQNIIRVANKLIKNNKVRYDKVMRPLQVEKGEIVLKEDMYNMISVGSILKAAKVAYKGGEGLLNGIGVIYREHQQVIPIINKLIEERIPFNCPYAENSKLYAFNMFIVKDIVGIIKLGNDMQNPALVKDYLYKICPNISSSNAENIAKTLKKNQVERSSNRIGVPVIKLSDLLKENMAWKRDLPILLELYNILQLKKDTDTYEVMGMVTSFIYSKYQVAYLTEHLRLKPRDTMYVDASNAYLKHHEMLDWSQFLSQQLDDYNWTANNSNINSGVQLVTFHTSKGLEYDETFILKVSSAVTLKPNILKKYSELGIQKYTEEERRLFYVAFTRAKHKATIFYDKEEPNHPFVKEIRDALEEIRQEDDQSQSLPEHAQSTLQTAQPINTDVQISQEVAQSTDAIASQASTNTRVPIPQPASPIKIEPQSESVPTSIPVSTLQEPDQNSVRLRVQSLRPTQPILSNGYHVAFKESY